MLICKSASYPSAPFHLLPNGYVNHFKNGLFSAEPLQKMRFFVVRLRSERGEKVY